MILCMRHEVAIQAVLVCGTKSEKQKLSRLSYLSHLPGPIIKKQMSCLVEILQKEVITAFGPSARTLGRAYPARPARDGWSWWPNAHILPGYEQQICQCVTGWQPSSQLLVHCCYISTLSKHSAKRQSASSVRGRQVASSETSLGFGLRCQNALKRGDLNPCGLLRQHITGLGSSAPPD